MLLLLSIKGDVDRARKPRNKFMCAQQEMMKFLSESEKKINLRSQESDLTSVEGLRESSVINIIHLNDKRTKQGRI